MTRIRIAIGVVIAAILLSIVSHWYLNTVMQDVLVQLDAAQALALNAEFESAKEELLEMEQYFDTHRHMLEMIVRREAITAISVNLHGLAAYAQEDTKMDLHSEIDKVTEQIHMLHHLFFSLV